MDPRYPEIEPHDAGLLDVGDGHRIAWEVCGNPEGRPAVFLHGGPGSGCSPGQRRLFHPGRYRAVLFDQRGSGRSTPGGETDAGLAANTTHHLVDDMESLRDHLGIDRWTLLGMSWGTTLALAYAGRHPDRVAGLVLASVTTTSAREVRWVTEDVGRIFPEEWERFRSFVPERLRDRPLVDAYGELLTDPDPAVREAAAREWCAWEDAHVSLAPGHRPSPRFGDPVFRLRFARLVTHYWRHAGFLGDEQLIRDAATLDGIPGVMVHGRYDVSGPLETPWRLARAWPTGRLRVIDDAGHGGNEDFLAAVVGALDALAGT